MPEPPDIGGYWLDKSRLGAKPSATLRFTDKLLERPLMRSALKQDPVLKSLIVLRQPNATNFKVTAAEWQRVSEALALRPEDIQGHGLRLPAKATKGKLATRQIDIHPKLAQLLSEYDNGGHEYLSPGRHGRGRLARSAADWLLDQAVADAGLAGLGHIVFPTVAIVTKTCSSSETE